jgi:hypothetical protein
MRFAAAAALFAPFVIPIPAAAQTFTKIADTATAVPGGSGTFSLFADARALDGGKVAFVAFDSGSGSGVYRWENGVLGVVADESTAVPGAPGQTFTSFFDVSIDSPFVAFTAGWPGPGGGCAFSGNEGLFGGRFAGGALRAVASSLSTPNHCFHGLDFESRVIAVAGGVNPVDVIHNHSESVMAVRRVGSAPVFLDTTTPSPSGGTFVGFDQDLSIRGNGLLFAEILPNTIGAVAGLYVIRNDGMGPRLVADRSTAVPGGTGTFMNFAGADWAGGEVAFVGRNSVNAAFLYAGTSPDDLRILVSSATAVPGEGANFGGVSNPIAYDDGRVVFSGFWLGSRKGLFTSVNGVVEAILKKGQMLDGKQVDSAFCRQGHAGGDRLLVEVRFADSSRGLYLVDLS